MMASLRYSPSVAQGKSVLTLLDVGEEHLLAVSLELPPPYTVLTIVTNEWSVVAQESVHDDNKKHLR